MLIQWTSALETGVESVDTQHKELVRQINSFHQFMKEGKGKEKTKEIFVF